jgi:hypothetical protein
MDYSLFNQEEEQPSYGLLKKAKARMSAGGTLSNNVTPGRTMLPNSIEALRSRASDLYKQGGDLYDQDPDMSQLQAFAKSRGDQGDSSMLTALAAQYAGESFQPVQEQLLKKAAAARDPIKMGSGLITAEGQYIKDPEAAQNKKAEFLLQQARMYEGLAQAAETKQEQMAYRAQQDRFMNEIRAMNAQTARMAAGNSGANKAPAGYQWATGPNGEPALTHIPGGPADPAVTSVKGNPSEDERKSAGYAFRMDNALRLITQLTGKDPSAETPKLMPSLAGKVPIVGDAASTMLTPASRQRVENAQLDALDAALTLATGAAYTKEQLKGLAKSYFPQYGETDPEVISDKKRRLAEIIQTAKIRAGRAMPQNGAGATPGGAGFDNNDPLDYRSRFGGRNGQN